MSFRAITEEHVVWFVRFGQQLRDKRGGSGDDKDIRVLSVLNFKWGIEKKSRDEWQSKASEDRMGIKRGKKRGHSR